MLNNLEKDIIHKIWEEYLRVISSPSCKSIYQLNPF